MVGPIQDPTSIWFSSPLRFFLFATVPQFSFIFHELNILEISVILLKVPQFGFIWCFLMIRLRLYIFGKNTWKQLCLFGTSQGVHDTDVSCSWDANLDHLIEVSSTGFLHYKVTIYLLQLKGILSGNTFKLYKFFISHPTSTH